LLQQADGLLCEALIYRVELEPIIARERRAMIYPSDEDLQWDAQRIGIARPSLYRITD